MITATLHFERDDDYDSIRLTAESIEALREMADAEVARRRPDHYWSSDVVESKGDTTDE